MKPIWSPYVLIMLAAAIICMFIGVYVWLNRRKNSETIPLILLLAGITEWIAAALMGLVDQNLTHKIIWAKIEYIGVVSVPLAVLGYVLQHSGSNQKLNFKRLAWLAVIPVATLVLAWTNGNHGFIWARYIPYHENGLVLSDKTYGPGFWVYWVYSYLVLLAATVITFRITLVPAKIFRWQSILVMIGILAPWVGNLLYVLHLDPFKNIDLTPLGFSITGILLAIGLFRWRLFDIKPIAQAAVLKGMADGLLILDNQDRIVEVNPAAQDILGLGVQELVGKQLEQVIANLLPPGEPSQQKREKTFEINLTNGKENRIYELSDSPFNEKHGTPGGRIIFLHDVTSRKHLEERLKETEQQLVKEALRESEDKFKYYFDHSSVGTSLTLPTGEINVNQAFCDMLGYNLPEFKNKKWQEITHPEDVELTQREVDQLLSGKRDSVRFIKRFIHKDGSVVWGDISSSMRRDADGKPLHLMSSVIDITERKQAEEVLAESEKKFSALFETMSEGIVYEDRDGKIISANPGAERLLGLSLDQMQGRTSVDPRWKAIHADGSPFPGETHSLHVAVKTGKPATGEVMGIYNPKSDAYVWLSVNSTPEFLPGEKNPFRAYAVFRDITERKLAEDAARKTQTLLTEAQRIAHMGSWQMDVASNYVTWSDELYRITGWNLELPPPDYTEHPKLFTPESWKLLNTVLPQTVETGIPYEVELEIVKPDGSHGWMLARGEAVRDARNVIVTLRGVALDITERKKAEKALRESEELLQTAVNILPVGLWIMNAEGKIVTSSAAAQRIWAGVHYVGIDQLGEYKGWRTDSGKRIEAHEWAGARALEKGETSIEEEVEIECFDGTHKIILDTAVPLRESDGSIGGAITINQDVTERKRSEKLMSLQSEVLKVINTDIPVEQTVAKVVAVIKQEAGFDAVGLRFRKESDYPFVASLGYSEGFLKAENSLTIRDPNGGLCRNEDGTVSLECTCGMIVSGKADPANPLFTPGGSAWTNNSLPFLDVPPEADPRLNPRNRCIHVGFLSLALIPIRSGGEILGLLHLADRRQDRFSLESIRFFEGIGLSIGGALARKQAEEEIQRLNVELEQRVTQRTAQLEAANKELDAFSYSVSHDLRAPLRGIDGWSLALLEDYGSQLDGQAKTYLERVRSEAQRMGQLIDDLLQLSRLTNTEMNPRKVNLSALAGTIADRLQKAQPERKVEFVIQPRLNANGDARLLEIALTNLLGNAFKFTGKTPQARIQFGQTEVEGRRAFFVGDNGAGFDMALAKKLFGAFQRMHKTSDFPGTGVGLTTVQRIVHRHGGRIWAEAAVDQGATFYFTLEEIP